jgi:heme/copper-type cytochrome/quinol oxidase subunit 2
MKRIPLPNRAIALPLIGLVFTWALFLVGQWVSMVAQDRVNYGPNQSVFVFFLALAVAAVSSLVAQGWATQAHDLSDGQGIERAAHRFTNLAVVLSLGALVIFVFGTFIGSFNNLQSLDFGRNFLLVYVPILLATALVIYVVLKAFVFRRKNEVVAGESKPRLSQQQKALALGYAIPILTTAFAIILGLAIYQATRTNLQIWVWVIIIAIVGYGVVMGTRFAAKAKSAKQAPPRPKTALAAGAANLNFVLSIVFGGVVSIMAFTYGGAAMSKLQVWANYVDGQTQPPYPTIDAPSWKWLIEELAPAKVLLLLAVIGVYLSITERHRKRETPERESGA